MDSTEAPPPYTLYNDANLYVGGHKAVIHVGFPSREIEWLRHVADGRAEKFCSTCNGPHSARSNFWLWDDDRLLKGYRRILQKNPDRFWSKWTYRLDSGTEVKGPSLRAAMNIAQWCPRRCNMHVQRGTTFGTPEEDSTQKNRGKSRPLFYHHSIDAKAVNGRLLVKIQSYRTLLDSKLSIEELRQGLPTCSHCTASVALAEQFKDAQDRFTGRKERLATLIFACRQCTMMEYIIMIVPRCPCHVPDDTRLLPSSRKYKQLSEKKPYPGSPSTPFEYAPFGVNYRSDWVIVFCRWKDLGPCRPSKPSGVQSQPGSVEMVQQQHPFEGFNTPAAAAAAAGGESRPRGEICTLFDGQHIWPYNDLRAKLTDVADSWPKLEVVLRGAPSVSSDGWVPRSVDVAS